jgi:hypothetical protein
VRLHQFVTSITVTGMVRMSDPHTERQRLVDRLVGLQLEMQSDPAPETRAQLLQAREALTMFDEMRHRQR